MSGIYSTRLWIAHDASGSPAVSYTVPAGFLVVLRSWDVFYGGAGAPTATLLCSTGPTVLDQFSVSLLGGGPHHYFGHQVLEAGETLYANISDLMDTAASGYVFRL